MLTVACFTLTLGSHLEDENRRLELELEILSSGCSVNSAEILDFASIFKPGTGNHQETKPVFLVKHFFKASYL